MIVNQTLVDKINVVFWQSQSEFDTALTNWNKNPRIRVPGGYVSL